MKGNAPPPPPHLSRLLLVGGSLGSHGLGAAVGVDGLASLDDDGGAGLHTEALKPGGSMRSSPDDTTKYKLVPQYLSRYHSVPFSQPFGVSRLTMINLEDVLKLTHRALVMDRASPSLSLFAIGRTERSRGKIRAVALTRRSGAS